MTVPKSHCCRGHDMSIYRRKRGGNGSAYCFKCNQDRMNERNAKRSLALQEQRKRRREMEGAFDILENVSPVYLRERVRAQAQAIKELQERIDSLTGEREELAARVERLRARLERAPKPVRHYTPKPYPTATQRNRPGAYVGVGTLLARIR